MRRSVFSAAPSIRFISATCDLPGRPLHSSACPACAGSQPASRGIANRLRSPPSTACKWSVSHLPVTALQRRQQRSRAARRAIRFRRWNGCAPSSGPGGRWCCCSAPTPMPACLRGTAGASCFHWRTSLSRFAPAMHSPGSRRRWRQNKGTGCCRRPPCCCRRRPAASSPSR